MMMMMMMMMIIIIIIIITLVTCMSERTIEISTDRLTLKNKTVSGISRGWQKEATKFYMMVVPTFSITCLVLFV